MVADGHDETAILTLIHVDTIRVELEPGVRGTRLEN